MNTRRSIRGQRGSVLIVAMLITAMLALVLASYFNLSLTSSRQTRRTFDRNTAFNLAEAGVEEAVWSYNQTLAGSTDAWRLWDTDGMAAWRRFNDFTLTSGSTGSVKVYASNTNPSGSTRPSIIAESTVETNTIGTAIQMLEVTLRRRSFFSNGLTARRTLAFKGTNTSFDSWDSDPDRNPATAPVDYSTANRTDVNGIASASLDTGAVLVNQASIYGYVSTGGQQPKVGTDGLIGPFGTAPGTINPARVATDFTANFPVFPSPSDGTYVSPLGTTLGTLGQATRWRTPNINLSGKQTLTILGDVTLILTAPAGTDAIQMAGTSAIIIPVGSSLTLYAEGDIKIAGQGLANANTQSSSFKVWGTNTTETGQSITLTGKGALRAVVYSPNGDVSLNGNGDMMGAVVARDIILTGNATFHYDSSLADLNDNAPYGPASWRLITSPSERRSLSAHFQGR
ncbi:MAG TPA: PilX N-terminal domain-containing pilus assembly protein [Roseimicrobium sp.]|nr:PilX N-terminal domain-containing pilus assembly protein [Roseimicrobium sp.]